MFPVLLRGGLSVLKVHLEGYVQPSILALIPLFFPVLHPELSSDDRMFSWALYFYLPVASWLQAPTTPSFKLHAEIPNFPGSLVQWASS